MSLWDRAVPSRHRAGPLEFHERQDRRIGPIFSFSVSGRLSYASPSARHAPGWRS